MIMNMQKVRLMKCNLCVVLFCLLCPSWIHSQIILDEDYSDWGNPIQTYSDDDNVGSPDILQVSVDSDASYIYFYFTLDRSILLQDNSGISLYLDIDNDESTGLQFNGIGADLFWNFGNRRGFQYRNGSREIRHADIGLISSPTVTGNEFEVAIERDNRINATIEDDIKFYLISNNVEWDYVPDRFEAETININSNSEVLAANYSIEKSVNSDFRIVSYNVLRDNIFNPSLENEYSNLLKAVDADVYCFQEVYDFSDEQLLLKLESLNVINNPEDWYSHKQNPDIITISKYPIVNTRVSDGNSIVVLNVDDRQVCIANCHLPCCDNNEGRVDEIDNLLANLREMKEGNFSFTLENEAPIIILGDMNLVGDASQVNSMITGNIVQNSIYGPDFSIDWDQTDMLDLVPRNVGTPSSYTWINPSGSFSPGRLDYLIISDSVIESEITFAFNTEGLSEEELDQYNLNTNTSLRCSDHLPLIADLRFRNTVSVVDLEDDNINFYPNPTFDNFQIDHEIVIDKVEILDINGRVIHTMSNMEIIGNIVSVHLDSGTYVVRIYSKGQVYNKKLIIQK